MSLISPQCDNKVVLNLESYAAVKNTAPEYGREQFRAMRQARFFSVCLRSSIVEVGVAYVTVFNSSATWAATSRLRGVQLAHAGYFRVSIIHPTLTCGPQDL